MNSIPTHRLISNSKQHPIKPCARAQGVAVCRHLWINWHGATGMISVGNRGCRLLHSPKRMFSKEAVHQVQEPFHLMVESHLPMTISMPGSVLRQRCHPAWSVQVLGSAAVKLLFWGGRPIYFLQGVWDQVVAHQVWCAKNL